MQVVADWQSKARWAQTWVPWAAGVRDSAQRAVLRVLKRPHEKEFAALPWLLPPAPFCVDVGANRGQSIRSMKLVLGMVGVWAFEPQRPLAEKLAWRYPCVQVHPFGLGERPETKTLYIPSYRGYRFDGLASTDPVLAVEWFEYSMWRFDPRHLAVAEEVIEVRTLDSVTFPHRVDFIKFDVQGMELAALRGARRLLCKDRPVLMVETPDESVMTFLKGVGYRPMYWVDGALTLVRPVFPLNVFFVAA
jgi:FkbM family methyltransferase